MIHSILLPPWPTEIPWTYGSVPISKSVSVDTIWNSFILFQDVISFIIRFNVMISNKSRDLMFVDFYFITSIWTIYQLVPCSLLPECVWGFRNIFKIRDASYNIKKYLVMERYIHLSIYLSVSLSFFSLSFLSLSCCLFLSLSLCLFHSFLSISLFLSFLSFFLSLFLSFSFLSISLFYLSLFFSFSLSLFLSFSFSLFSLFSLFLSFSFALFLSYLSFSISLFLFFSFSLFLS